MNRRSRMPTTSAGFRRADSGVKSTTSANRIDAAANWSAIVVVSALSFSAMERGRMFNSRFSALSCSACRASSTSSRWRTNATSSPNTTAPVTVTLSAIIVLSNQAGRVDLPPPASSPTSPETRKIATKAMNQRTPAFAPSKTSAPSGARMPHRPTAPEATKPPDECHRDRRSDQDVEQLDPQESIAVAGAGEDDDRHDRDDQVQPGDETCQLTEGEVDRAPGDGDREDQDADEDEERLAEPHFVVVPWIGTDPCGPVDPRLSELRDSVHER